MYTEIGRAAGMPFFDTLKASKTLSISCIETYANSSSRKQLIMQVAHHANSSSRKQLITQVAHHANSSSHKQLITQAAYHDLFLEQEPTLKA
jgi:hypothetical protein